MMLAKLEATLGRVVSRRLLHILVSTVPLVWVARVTVTLGDNDPLSVVE